MASALACRACLVTDTNLLDLRLPRLSAAYQQLTGLQVCDAAPLPRLVCGGCASVLVHSWSLRVRCLAADRLMRRAMASGHAITTEYVREQTGHQRRHGDPVLAQSGDTWLESKLDIFIEPTDNIKLEYDEQRCDGDDEPGPDFKSSESERSYDETPAPAPAPRVDSEAGARQGDSDDPATEHRVRGRCESDKPPDHTIDYIEVDVTAQLDCDDEPGQPSPYEDVELPRYTPAAGSSDEAPTECHDSDTGHGDTKLFDKVCDTRSLEDSDTDTETVVDGASFNGSVRAVLLTKQQRAADAEARRTCREYRSAPYKCRMCFKGYESDGDYRRHMLRHDARSGALPCAVCGCRYGEAQALSRHESSHRLRYVCALCPHLTAHINKARRHYKRQHYEPPQDATGIKCYFCSARPPDERSLSEHLQTHFATSATPSGTSRSARQGQRQRTERHRATVCEVCGHQCASATRLRRHLRAHGDRRPLSCAHCAATFTSHERLKIHGRIHSGERPYRCTHCAKCFRTTGILSVHKRIHSGAMPYPCAVCGRRFRQRSAMRVHLRTHCKQPPAPAAPAAQPAPAPAATTPAPAPATAGGGKRPRRRRARCDRD